MREEAAPNAPQEPVGGTHRLRRLGLGGEGPALRLGGSWAPRNRRALRAPGGACLARAWHLDAWHLGGVPGSCLARAWHLDAWHLGGGCLARACSVPALLERCFTRRRGRPDQRGAPWTWVSDERRLAGGARALALEVGVEQRRRFVLVCRA